jgi:hypothetical protein
VYLKICHNLILLVGAPVVVVGAENNLPKIIMRVWGCQSFNNLLVTVVVVLVVGTEVEVVRIA